VFGNRQVLSGDPRRAAGISLPSVIDRIVGTGRPVGGRKASRQTVWLAMILAAGFAVPANAQMFWPNDPGESIYEQPRSIEPRRPRVVRHKTPKLPDAPRDTAKPQGPIIIAISIDNQHLKIYDSNGVFAESPVSTGMRGHSTPMGVFSIIQKNKYHRSNIYSGAPMPYMQRITWSGVALHAGALPGYPASHGCIRMPMNFAMRLWGWTRMGARVIITPGDVAPAEFASAHLIARKADVKSASASDGRKDFATTAKTDKAEAVDVMALTKRELRLSSITDRAEPIRTADASGSFKMSDAGSEELSATVSDPSASEAPKDEGTKDGGDTSVPTTDKPADGDTQPGETKPDKDQTRATDPAKAVTIAAPLEGAADFIGPVRPRSGHLAAYVSRKDNKLYVRQNFETWFETPVTIADADRPLGTHVFTARADTTDSDAFRWSVVSLPATARAATRSDDNPRRSKKIVEVAAPAASSPSEALDRVTIPDSALKRIASALAPGGSLIVSDQGLGDETGRGTDFIVPLR